MGARDFLKWTYKVLEDHYKMLKNNNPNCDNNQEIFVKALCNLQMLMSKAIRSGDSDKYVKLTEQYSKTFARAGLKTIQEIDNSAKTARCYTRYNQSVHTRRILQRQTVVQGL